MISLVASVLTAGADTAIIEPVLTWNLFWTTILVPISTLLLGLYLRHIIHKKEKREEESTEKIRRTEIETAVQKAKKDAEIADLLAKLEAEKEKATLEWRENQTRILCKVKTTVEDLIDALPDKVNKVDCIREHRDTWEAITDLRKTKLDV